MTLTIRRVMLAMFRIPALFFSILWVPVWWAWFHEMLDNGLSGTLVTAEWWGIWRPSSPSDLPWALAALTFLTVFPLVSELILRSRFRRSPSPEIFFMRLFLLTLPLQAVRIGIPLIVAGYINGAWALPFTRMAWFARFLSIGALLNVGLFTGDLPFRRSGAMVGIGAVTALAVAVLLPLDITQTTGNLLYRVGSEKSLALVCLSLEILSVVSLFVTALGNENRRYLVLAAAFFLIVIAADMLFFISQPLIIVALVALVLGTFFFAREVRILYQWI